MPDQKPTDHIMDELTKYRVREIAGEVFDQKSKQQWEAFGVDVTQPAGVLIHRQTLDWVRETKARSETLGKRVVLYLGAAMTTLGFLGGLIKWALDYFGTHGVPPT